MDIDGEEYEVDNTLINWRSALHNRRQELMKDERTKERSEESQRGHEGYSEQGEHPKCLRGPSNFLAWIEKISSLTKKLPETTSNLKVLSLIKNSITNRYDLKEIEEINSVKVLMEYLNSKYLGSPSLLHDSLKPIRDSKDSWSKMISISNVQMCLNLFSRLKAGKLDQKIETVHLALFEQKTLMVDRRSKYYEEQVQALREAKEEAVKGEPENGRAMVLNLSIRINEAQTQEMIGAKIDFFFNFIEKEVAALRYQIAQERNYDQKGRT